MASLNRCTFIGNLGRDPETRVVGSNTVCNFSIACNEKWTGKDGQKQERTEWVRVQVWGKQADACAQYLGKGSLVYVEGRMQTREYEKDGEKRYATEINASNVVFLGGRQQEQSQQHGGGSAPDDLIPF